MRPRLSRVKRTPAMTMQRPTMSLGVILMLSSAIVVLLSRCRGRRFSDCFPDDSETDENQDDRPGRAVVEAEQFLTADQHPDAEAEEPEAGAAMFPFVGLNDLGQPENDRNRRPVMPEFAVVKKVEQADGD